MKLKLYRSATVGLDFDGFKILTDPWLTDGEHLGSWSHYPEFNFDEFEKEINSYDAIYVSHIHPDHCSSQTLAKMNKKIPIYIHSFHRKFLKFKLESLGFKVIELENGRPFKFRDNLSLNIFAADNCNPELCYKFSGCADLTAKNGSQQIDTLSVFKHNDNVLVNVNDCPFELAKSTFDQIKKNYKEIKVLLTGYCGAGPYPQCFSNLNDDEKIFEAKKKQEFFLKQAIDYIEKLEPSYYLPFAGTYTLTGKLAKLNNFRGNPSLDDAYDYFENHFKNSKFFNHIKPIKINPGESFDLILKKTSSKYRKLNKNHFLNRVSELSKRKLYYEEEKFPKFDEIIELVQGATKKFIDKKLLNNVKLKTDIIFDLNGKFLKLEKDKSKIEVIDSDNFGSNYIIFKMDIRLFKLLLKGPRFASWNDAEGGSHITFFRKPNTFERGLHQLMQHFHN